MQPRIEILSEKKLVGKYIRTSLAKDNTLELWQSFMPKRNEIRNRVTTELISLRVYDGISYFQNFNPNNEFDKWALAEVSDFDVIPEGMKPFILPGGLHAVFLYKGVPSAAGPTFQYIFQIWLPTSEYELDNRPHFEILGTKYKNDQPDSEEEIWIPVKKKLGVRS